MPKENKPRRFPRQYLLRELGRLQDLSTAYRAFYLDRSGDQSIGAAARELAAEREGFCDDLYHDLESIARELYLWR